MEIKKVFSLKEALEYGGMWKPILRTPFGIAELPTFNASNTPNKSEVEMFERYNRVIYLRVR